MITFLVHSGEGYLGYFAAADVYRVPAGPFGRYSSDRCGPDVGRFNQLESGWYFPPARYSSKFPAVRARSNVLIPTGESIELPDSVCQASAMPVARIDRVITGGRQMLGTPYHWGGKTSAGIDCSGLVQVALPRPASICPAIPISNSCSGSSRRRGGTADRLRRERYALLS